MATPVDITLLEETKGPLVTLLPATIVHGSGAGSEYSGFDGLDRLHLVVQARNLRGNTSRSLTVMVEQSADGDSWETAAEHEFTGNDTYRTEIDAPQDQLRVVWTAAGGLKSASLDAVIVTVGFLDEITGGGSILSALLSFSVGGGPAGIAFTPDGLKAYVCNSADGTVTPIDVATDTPAAPYSVDLTPACVAFTPDGLKAYVANFGDWTVTPIDVATDTPGASIAGFGAPEGLVITPDGVTAYVTNNSADFSSVIPIDVATDTPGTPISVGALNNPWGIAVSPDGQKLYVCIQNTGTVLPIALPSETPGSPIAVGAEAAQVAFSPDGTKAYVTDPNGFVVPIDVATDTPGSPIEVGEFAGAPNSLAFSPDGETVYFVVGDRIGRIDVATDTLLPAVTGASGLGGDVGGPIIAFTPDGTKAYVTADTDNVVHVIARLPYSALA